MILTSDLIKDSVLNEVGEGRLSVEEAERELREANIAINQGLRSSLLAFSASAILVGAGFTRNGY